MKRPQPRRWYDMTKEERAAELKKLAASIRQLEAQTARKVAAANRRPSMSGQPHSE